MSSEDFITIGPVNNPPDSSIDGIRFLSGVVDLNSIRKYTLDYLNIKDPFERFVILLSDEFKSPHLDPFSGYWVIHRDSFYRTKLGSKERILRSPEEISGIIIHESTHQEGRIQIQGKKVGNSVVPRAIRVGAQWTQIVEDYRLDHNEQPLAIKTTNYHGVLLEEGFAFFHQYNYLSQQGGLDPTDNSVGLAIATTFTNIMNTFDLWDVHHLLRSSSDYYGSLIAMLDEIDKKIENRGLSSKFREALAIAGSAYPSLSVNNSKDLIIEELDFLNGIIHQVTNRELIMLSDTEFISGAWRDQFLNVLNQSR